SHQGAPTLSLQRQHRRQRRALSLRRDTWARDARLDGIGPAHEARHPARGSLRAQRGRSDLIAPRQPRDRVFLMTVYGCGLRISEATQLKTSDIDRARMQLRVRDGKGAKGRVLPLSERLLKELVNYWRAQRQDKAGHNCPWLFLGKKAGQPMSTYAGQN